MPWDRKRLLGYVEIIQLILGVTDKTAPSVIKEYIGHWLDMVYLPPPGGIL